MKFFPIQRFLSDDRAQSVFNKLQFGAVGRVPILDPTSSIGFMDGQLYVQVCLPLPISALSFPSILSGLVWAENPKSWESLGQHRVVAFNNADGQAKLEARLGDSRQLQIEWTRLPTTEYRVRVELPSQPDGPNFVTSVYADTGPGAIEVAEAVFQKELGWRVSSL